MAWAEWFQPDPRCDTEYTHPIARWIANCPDNRIAPVLVTPAAPRSIAEMTSGLWTPEEMWRQTRANWTSARVLEQARLAGNVNSSLDANPDGSGKMSTTDWVIVGSLAAIGIVVLKKWLD
jgi:hypothetical protein